MYTGFFRDWAKGIKKLKQVKLSKGVVSRSKSGVAQYLYTLAIELAKGCTIRAVGQEAVTYGSRGGSSDLLDQLTQNAINFLLTSLSLSTNNLNAIDLCHSQH